MIIRPSVAQILKGVVHELGTSLKEGIDDPVKIGQIDTICGVLSACAVRAEHEQAWIQEEVQAILDVGLEFLSAGKATPELDAALKKHDATASDMKQYESASEILSLMGDIGAGSNAQLSKKVMKLMEQRLTNEGYVIGGGFEAAGRG